MITVDDHLAEILTLVGKLPGRQQPLLECLGAAAAVDLVATSPMPGFDNSAMDGYAVRASDIAKAPVTLAVVADIAAGDLLQGELAQGSAARIMTGAPLPAGADCVVPVEQTDAGTKNVEIRVAAPAGSCIRRAGEDVQVGDVLLGAGDRIGPAQAGLAAAAGAVKLSVVPLPTVCVVSTGAELQPPGTDLAPGRIFDSNSTSLAALARASGLTAKTMACHTDDPAQFTSVIKAAAAGADLVLTSGGVSAGSHEVVKDVLGERSHFAFRKVAMQPGKPQGFGKIDDTVVLDFPGNPVSAAVSFMVFARPVIAKMAGQSEDVLFPRNQTATLAETVTRKNLRQFLRGSLEPGTGAVTPSRARGSHLLAGLARADRLIVIPEGDGEVEAGAQVEVIPLP